MRALLVGAGGMGRAWARNLTSNGRVKLAGWVDVRSGAARQAASELDIVADYLGEDFASGIAEAKPDFVVDVTPPEVHYDIVYASPVSRLAGDWREADGIGHG